MAHQRSGIHGHMVDNTEATGGGKGAENRDEAEISKLFEGTGSVTSDVDVDSRTFGLGCDLAEEGRGQRAQGCAKSKCWFKLPKPKAFDGARDAKELENFLWDMEEYFQVTGVPDSEKVAMTSMYLSGDSKLWWRTCVVVDASAGRERIGSWERLKKELKLQLLPGNANIQSMSDEDKLFNFMAGLQSWAQSELRRQNLNDLSSAIAAAGGLVDFAGAGSQGKDGNKTKGESGEGKSVSAGKSKRVETMAASTTGESRLKTGCWNCGGDHLRRNCPKKQTVNTLKDVESKDDETAPQICNLLRLI
nr:hypothetical protein CDL12_02170 [Ipomoea batatas]